jgi:hypothetical protein
VAWFSAPTEAALAGRQTDSGIIETPGPDWKPLGPIPNVAAPESEVAWIRGDDVLSIHSVPNDLCASAGIDGRTAMSFVAVAAGLEYDSDIDGVSRYESGRDPAEIVLVFEGASMSFALDLRSASSTSSKVADELDRVAELQIAAAGGVTAPASRRPSRLDALILTSDPSGTIGGADIDLDSFNCRGPRTTPVIEFLQRNTAERTMLFQDQAAGDIVVVSTSDYPYDLFAAAAAGAKFSPRLFSPARVRGLDKLTDATAWSPVGSPQQVLIRLRRGRILLDVTALSDTRAHADEIALAYARAQEKLLPAGGTSRFVFPSAGQSIVNSSLLVGVVGTATLGLRRVRAGRSPRRRSGVSTTSALPPNNVIVVNDLAASLRRHGRALACIQLLVVAVVIIGVAADIGSWRWVIGSAGIVLGIAVTWFARRREDRLLGTTSERAHPGLSIPAALTLLVGISTLLAGGWLLVFGLREVLFTPSLTHLRLADRFNVEPRRLAWIMFGTGIALLFGGAVLCRAARALARIGWRRETTHEGSVVYLRSFGDDNLRLASTLSARRPFVEWFNIRGREPFEESVAWELAVVGPVIAIGRPGTTRATLGAAREHFSDSEWQHVISERMASARMIAVTIGSTDGLAWELSHIVEHGYLPKCIFVVPPTTSDDASLRWEFTRAALVRAGASVVDLVELPDGALILQPQERATSSAFAADQVDEASYRAAIARSTSPSDLSHARIDWGPPTTRPVT